MLTVVQPPSSDARADVDRAPPVQRPKSSRASDGVASPSADATPRDATPSDPLPLAPAALPIERVDPLPASMLTAGVTGAVYDESTYAPAIGLPVALLCTVCTVKQQWSKTRAGGRFDFHGLPEGRHQVVVHAYAGTVSRAVNVERGEVTAVAIGVAHDKTPATPDPQCPPLASQVGGST